MPMLPERITRRVTHDDSGCWLWSGQAQKNGYGATTWKVNGRWTHVRVHRLFYETYKGPIPEGLEIDHTCKVKRCVNPEHLRAVTHQENLRTRAHRGPARKAACNYGHAFTEENTYIDGRGNRNCRVCRDERSRVWKQAHKPLQRHPRFKLTRVDADRIRQLRQEGMLLREIAEQFGVGVPQVHRIVTGRSWAP